MWEDDSPERRFPDKEAAYLWYSTAMGINLDEAGISRLDADQCNALISLIHEAFDDEVAL